MYIDIDGDSQDISRLVDCQESHIFPRATKRDVTTVPVDICILAGHRRGATGGGGGGGVESSLERQPSPLLNRMPDFSIL